MLLDQEVRDAKACVMRMKWLQDQPYSICDRRSSNYTVALYCRWWARSGKCTTAGSNGFQGHVLGRYLPPNCTVSPPLLQARQQVKDISCPTAPHQTSLGSLPCSPRRTVDSTATSRGRLLEKIGRLDDQPNRRRGWLPSPAPFCASWGVRGLESSGQEQLPFERASGSVSDDGAKGAFGL